MEKQNKMGTEPIPRLLRSMAYPMILSYFVNAIYNVIDSLFVSYLTVPGIENASDKAVTALSLAFPIQMLIIAFGVGIGVGVNANLSKHLGEGRKKMASKVAGNAIFISGCCYLGMFLFSLFGITAFMHWQQVGEITTQMGIQYLKIISMCSFGTIGAMCFEKLLQATGRTKAVMVGQLAGSVVNLILDPILIFGCLGFPQMGVQGAAIATVLGQSTSFIVACACHFKLNTEIENQVAYLKPDRIIIHEIFSVGIPAGMIQALSAVLLLGMNKILAQLSVYAVTAYGIYYKFEKFVLLPTLGLNNASIPIIAYNHGAKSRERVWTAIKAGLIHVVIMMSVGTLIFHIFAGNMAVSYTHLTLPTIA